MCDDPLLDRTQWSYVRHGFVAHAAAGGVACAGLTAPISEVQKFLQSLATDIRSGRVKYFRPDNPERYTSGTTMWLEETAA
jgi:hypothetical protein